MRALFQGWMTSWFGDRQESVALSKEASQAAQDKRLAAGVATPTSAEAAMAQASGAVSGAVSAVSTPPDTLDDLQAVTQDGLSIAKMYPAQRTPQVVLAAVTQNGLAVYHLTRDQRTEQVCLAAVSQNGRAVQHLSPLQRTPAVRLAAVRKCGFALHYFTAQERTPEVALAAVQQDGWVVEMLSPELRTAEVCIAAIEKTPHAVRFLTEDQLRPEVCLAAVKRNRLLARQLPAAQMVRPPMVSWLREHWSEIAPCLDTEVEHLLECKLRDQESVPDRAAGDALASGGSQDIDLSGFHDLDEMPRQMHDAHPGAAVGADDGTGRSTSSTRSA
jgi:hypothetical protein